MLAEPASAAPAPTAGAAAKPKRVKPAKPRPDFPLFPHATGRWAKKIGGKFAFFGPWEDPFGALDRYLARRDALRAEPHAPRPRVVHESPSAAPPPSAAPGRRAQAPRHAANVARPAQRAPSQALSLDEGGAAPGLTVREMVIPDELDDTGTFNTANEQTARDIDTNSSNDYTLAYDAVGNMTDDGVDYDYVYDWMGRLRKVKTQGGALVAEYWYNGLNHRLSWHYDNTRSGGGAPDGTTDSNDKKYHFAYDTRWRIVAVFRESDTAPKERYVWHNAGTNGTGGSSYIDACVLRDRDINSGWTASGDGTLEERVYYGQNWRADVSVVLSDTGKVKEWVKYSSYGVPFSITPADFNGDGFVNGNDDDEFDAAYNGGAGAWDARVDLDLSGTLTSADDTAFTSEFNGGEAGGYRVLSRTSVANRLGYAGYQHAPELAKTTWHVRFRMLLSELGRWTRRDPIGYVDGANMYLSAMGMPVVHLDPLGLAATIGGHCWTCCGPPPCCNDCTGSGGSGGIGIGDDPVPECGTWDKTQNKCTNTKACKQGQECKATKALPSDPNSQTPKCRCQEATDYEGVFCGKTPNTTDHTCANDPPCPEGYTCTWAGETPGGWARLCFCEKNTKNEL